MRLCPDVNTEYFDKEDALLLALNFKNPPGRLLRRQWTYPMKSMPDIATWRQFVKEEKCEMVLPLLDIPSHKSGMLRVNQKFCFPCDNSVIRVDKSNVAGRRFGGSVILKDNLAFGIQENEDVVVEKVPGQDELFNQETKKNSNRNCQFWLEFENKARLNICMMDPVEPQRDLIPPLTGSEQSQSKKVSVLGTIEQPEESEHEAEAKSKDEAASLKKS